MHLWHEKNNAVFVDAGLWLRPRYYKQGNENLAMAAKREAAKAGYSKLRITSVTDGGYGADLRRNCWSVVVATGIAFN